jgi:hypothetical protein
MLDDTCYLIGFDKIGFAVYSLILLNSKTFVDAKKTFTKDVLMRIDFLELAKNMDLKEFDIELKKLNESYNLKLNLNLWEDFTNQMRPANSGQLEMFA